MAETGNPNGADTLLWVEGIAIPSETGENRTYTTIAVEQDQSARTNRAVGYYENVLGEPLLFVWPKGDLSGQLWIYRRDESAYRECRICLMAQTESRNMAAVIVVELLAADGQSDARDRSLGTLPVPARVKARLRRAAPADRSFRIGAVSEDELHWLTGCLTSAMIRGFVPSMDNPATLN